MFTFFKTKPGFIQCTFVHICICTLYMYMYLYILEDGYMYFYGTKLCLKYMYMYLKKHSAMNTHTRNVTCMRVSTHDRNCKLNEITTYWTEVLSSTCTCTCTYVLYHSKSRVHVLHVHVQCSTCMYCTRTRACILFMKFVYTYIRYIFRSWTNFYYIQAWRF